MTQKRRINLLSGEINIGFCKENDGKIEVITITPEKEKQENSQEIKEFGNGTKDLD